MSFRFLRLTTLYPQFLEQFLRTHRDVESLSYQALYDRQVAARFAESDFQVRHLSKLGIVAENQFLSFELLQKKWAREHGESFRPDHWFADIAVAQTRAFQPDVLYLDDLYSIDWPLRQRLKSVCRRTPLVVAWRASPTEDYSAFRDLDLVFTCVEDQVAKFRAAGVRAELLRHGFEASLLQELAPLPVRDVPLSFAGSLGSLHTDRGQIVESLMARLPLHIWSGDATVRGKDRLRWALRKLGFPQSVKSRIASLPLDYGQRIHPAIFGCDYYRVLARSQLSLNQHHPLSAGMATNMRLFEVTGMGACLVTESSDNLRELFEPDQEVVTYGSLDECVEKVRYLLDHDRERQSIAAAGQRRTLQHHNYETRMRRLVAFLTQSPAKAA